MNPNEANQETLECARYGEDDDLRELLTTTSADPNYADDNGTTALHRAAANGQVSCLKVLKEFGSIHRPNVQGNLPIHWAALNGQVESLKYLFDHYDVDVLTKNDAGRSTLTEAFQSQKTEVIEICLSHPSATEEKLMETESPDAKLVTTMDENDTNDDMDVDRDPAYDEKNAVVHEMDFSSSIPKEATEHTKTTTTSPTKRITMKIRELPITRADNPFGSESNPDADTTGLGIWPASVLLARWVVQERSLLQGKTVAELGAGCGLPALAAALYCAPHSVYLTDIHEPTLKNAAHNARLNGSSIPQPAPTTQKIDQTAPSTHPFIECVNIHNNRNNNNNNNNSITGSITGTVFNAPTGGYATAAATAVTEPTTTLYVSKVSWSEPSTFPPARVDVLIGSDLVYDSAILTLLTQAVDGMLAADGVFLYIAPDECRDGIDGLVNALASVGLECILQQPCDERDEDGSSDTDVNESARGVAMMTVDSDDMGAPKQTSDERSKLALVDRGDQFVLHFYDLAAKKPHTQYKFSRRGK